MGSARLRLAARALRALAVAVVPLALLLAAAELAVRATGAAESCPNVFSDAELWVCDPILHFKANPALRPNDQALNREGFRSAEFGPKRPGVYRILALGDSCTFGYIAHATIGFVAQPYPLRLERLVERRNGPGRIEVLNAGQPGYNSFQGLLLLRTKLRGLEPDLVTVRFGWNDHFLSPLGEPSPFREPDSALGLALEDLWLRSKLYAFVRRLGLELRALREPPRDPRAALRAAREWRPTIPIGDYARNLRRIVDVARGLGAEAWLLTAPRNPDPNAKAARELAVHNRTSFRHLMEAHDAYGEALRRVGQETGALVVDLEAVYARHAGEPVFIPTDVVHPSQGGHHLEAETLYAALARRGVIEARPDPAGSAGPRAR
jgi:lysophospholipase L1-like esterase